MLIFSSHWNHFNQIVEQYHGNIVLSDFFKNYFSNFKNCGSKDRKIIRDLVFTYFRISHLVDNPKLPEHIFIGLFLSNKSEYEKQINERFPILQEGWHFNFKQKIEYLITLGFRLSFERYFKNLSALSKQIDQKTYIQNFFLTPVFFIRLIHNASLIKKVLSQHLIVFETIQTNIIKVYSAQNIDIVLKHYESDFFIQDLSCQNLLEYLNLKGDEKIWDACSGSGGKSILIKTRFPQTQIWNTDVRASILFNLKKRYKALHIIPHDIKTLNLEEPIIGFNPDAEIILADVPCSGSGTWAATPEKKHFYNPSNTLLFVQKQQRIIKNLVPFLNDKNKLFYVTCSIFEAENENQIAYFEQHFNLKSIFTTYISNTEHSSDTIFVCCLQRIIKL